LGAREPNPLEQEEVAMKTPLETVLIAVFAMSFLSCGDEEEPGNYCKKLEEKVAADFEEFCKTHSDCWLCKEEMENSEELTEAKCKSHLKDYDNYLNSVLSWELWCRDEGESDGEDTEPWESDSADSDSADSDSADSDSADSDSADSESADSESESDSESL
jgi:hypothetical protein